MTAAMGDVEPRIQELVRAGSHDAAATLVLETYGPEVFGYLVHTLGNESDAGEVFSQTAEDLWKGLPSFGFRCSVRTWIYVLGRHAISRYRRSPWNKGARRVGESRVESLAELARSRTQPWRRTEVKDRMAALRDALDEDDRTLLTLRVDRDLGWDDIARVMLGLEEPDAKLVTKESARLRKRFQLLKDELRRKAQEAGLLEQR